MTEIRQSVRRKSIKLTETVYCKAYRLTTQSDFTSNAWAKINLNAVVDDNGNNFDTGTSMFVVPVTGLYEFIVAIEFSGVLATKAYKGAIYVNGASVKEVSSHASVTSNLTITFSDKIYLRENDEVELYTMPDVGGSANTVDVVSGSKATTLTASLVTKEGIRQ